MYVDIFLIIRHYLVNFVQFSIVYKDIVTRFSYFWIGSLFRGQISNESSNIFVREIEPPLAHPSFSLANK